MHTGKVVLTGGTGFIMSHVAECLAPTGREIVLFDNNAEHDLYRETRQLLADFRNLHFVRGDVRDADAVARVLDGAETVYHFAALLGTSARFRQEALTMEVNVLGTINVLHAALDAHVEFLIYAPRPPLTMWLTPYIISKTTQTHLIEMYHRVHGLPTVGLNIANCYGPRERPVLTTDTLRPHEGQKFIASCITAALRNEPITVFGDGEQSSDFVFVDDVVNACLAAEQEGAIGETVDVGSGVDTTVNGVVEMVIGLTGSRSGIERLPMRSGEVKVHTKADLAAAKKYLDWEPAVDLRDGLRKTIPWYARQVGVPSPV